MPFTPVHMGPGILIKSLLQGSFSLMVFGWSQIVMDLQPLYVLIQGHGHLHGFSHTYIGAVLLGVVAALSGKYLSEFGLWLLRIKDNGRIRISWRVVFLTAFIGTFSHVAIDSVMHSDMEPLYPLTAQNHLLGATSAIMLHKICLYTGVVGGVLYYVLRLRQKPGF